MKNFTLIYFRGCPNYEPAKALLKHAGIEFVEVCQDELNEMDPYKSYSSPTLLSNSQIVFGGKISESSRGCSLKLPSVGELLDALQSR